MRFKPVEVNVAYYDVGNVTHSFDESGNHRLEFKGHMSEWALYGELAKLTVDGTTFIGTTEYFWGVLPEVFIALTLKEHDNPYAIVPEPEIKQPPNGKFVLSLKKPPEQG